MLNQPTSSPMITRMFGFLFCAVAGGASDIDARLKHAAARARHLDRLGGKSFDRYRFSRETDKRVSAIISEPPCAKDCRPSRLHGFMASWPSTWTRPIRR